MVKTVFFDLKVAIRSIWAYKRRSFAVGAGMVIGVTIFASVIFYGGILGSIVIQDVLSNIESEVTFVPTSSGLSNASTIANSIEEHNEIASSLVLYGIANYYNDDWSSNKHTIQVFTLANTSEHDMMAPYFEPTIVPEDDLSSPIITNIGLEQGDNDLSGDKCFVHYSYYTQYNVQLNQQLTMNYTIIEGVEINNNFVQTIIFQQLINFTIGGFFDSSYFNEYHFIFGAQNVENELIEILEEINYYQIPVKLDYRYFETSDRDEFIKGVRRLINTIESEHSNLIGINMIESLLMISTFEVIVMQIVDFILFIPVLVLSVLLIFFGAELALQERRYEMAVLKAQGASPKQIRGMVFSEVILIGTFATLLGMFLGSITAALVATIRSFMQIDFIEAYEIYQYLDFNPTSLIFIFLLPMLLLMFITNRKAVEYIKQEVALSKGVEKKKVSLFKRAYIDVFFFVNGLIGALLLLISDTVPTINLHPLLYVIIFFSPITLWIGAAGVVSRIATKIPEKADRLVLKILKDIGLLVKGSLSRRHQNFPVITVLLCMSISLSVLAAVQGETTRMTVVRETEFLIGGDMYLRLSTSSLNLTKADFGVHADKIDSIVPLYVAQGVYSYSGIRFYGADLKDFGDNAIWHRDSFVGYPNWKEAIDKILEDPTRNIAIGRDLANSYRISVDSTFSVNIGDQTNIQTTVSCLFNHVPGGIIGTWYDGAALVDKEFLLANADNFTLMYAAIVNLKKGVDPIKENIEFHFNNLDSVIEVQLYDKVLAKKTREQGRLFGIPGLLTINYLAALLISILGIFIFMFMIINRRKKEFAILIAEGASRRQVIMLVLSEILSLAIFATLFGGFIGIILGYQFNGFFGFLSTILTFGFGASIQRRIIFPLDVLAITIVSSFIAIILAALIPANIASKTKVVEEMRQD